MSAPVCVESPLCRCDRRAGAMHAALCPSPRRQSQRLPRTAAARCAQAYAADRRQHRRVAAPEQATVRRCPCAGPRPARGDVRGVCPDRLQKENPE